MSLLQFTPSNGMSMYLIGPSTAIQDWDGTLDLSCMGFDASAVQSGSARGDFDEETDLGRQILQESYRSWQAAFRALPFQLTYRRYA